MTTYTVKINDRGMKTRPFEVIDDEDGLPVGSAETHEEADMIIAIRTKAQIDL